MLPQEHDQALLIPDRDSQEHRSYQIEHRSLG
jgi:hypothetical protein